jgi:hypothetical protein
MKKAPLNVPAGLWWLLIDLVFVQCACSSTGPPEQEKWWCR